MGNNIKKCFVFFVAMFVFLTGCASTENYNEESVGSSESSCSSQNEAYDAIEIEPGETKYFVTINISQSHFTLDLGQHLKDAMNDINIEIMVDKDYYDSFEVGDSINDDFRWGSFITSGSLGNWDITISDKHEVTG